MEDRPRINNPEDQDDLASEEAYDVERPSVEMSPYTDKNKTKEYPNKKSSLENIFSKTIDTALGAIGHPEKNSSGSSREEAEIVIDHTHEYAKTESTKKEAQTQIPELNSPEELKDSYFDRRHEVKGQDNQDFDEQAQSDFVSEPTPISSILAQMSDSDSPNTLMRPEDTKGDQTQSSGASYQNAVKTGFVMGVLLIIIGIIIVLITQLF